MPGVLEQRDSPSVRARRRAVERGWGTAAEKLVRPLLVVEEAEAIERPLLPGQVVLWRPGGRGLERAMHAIMGAVLLRMTRENPLVLNPQAHPPDIELREPVDPRGREGHAIVGADGLRQAVLPKETIDDGADSHTLGRWQAVTREEIAGMLVRHGQRVAVDT